MCRPHDVWTPLHQTFHERSSRLCPSSCRIRHLDRQSDCYIDAKTRSWQPKSSLEWGYKQFQPSIGSRSAVCCHHHKLTNPPAGPNTGKQSRIMLSPSTLGIALFAPGTWRLGCQLEMLRTSSRNQSSAGHPTLQIVARCRCWRRSKLAASRL